MAWVLRAACVALAALAGASVSAEEGAGTRVTDSQVFMMMFADQGRSVGYQSMLSAIQLETVQAQLKRDRALLERNLELYDREAISLLDLEIAQLKDAWSQLLLVVARKNLETIAAQVSALTLIGDPFAGKPAELGALRIARANYENRAARLDRCRQVFFQSQSGRRRQRLGVLQLALALQFIHDAVAML